MSDLITRYNSPARILHWVMALLVLMMIPAGVIMVQEGLDRSLQNTLFIFHKNVGTLLLLLIIARIAYRRLRPPPPLPDTVPAWQHKIADATHMALYGLLVAMPLLGYIRVRAGGFPIESLDALGVPALVPRSDALAGVAKTLHFYGAIAIGVVIAMHIGAALFHGIIRRDGIFSRMWPPFGGGAT